MSYDFFNSKTVVPRKEHFCEHCGKKISAGERCRYSSGLYEGDFMSYYEHEDCRAAWLEVAAEILRDDNFAPFLRDMEDLTDSRPFLAEKYPAVAARLWPAAGEAA